jgi:hypothetical protein
MAISAKKYPSRRLRARELSFHFHLDFRTSAFASSENDRILGGGTMDGCAPAMSIALEIEFAALEFFSRQQGGGGDNDT